MVSACPQESDPRPKVAKFVSDPSERAISGLRSEGLETLVEVVREEVGKQHPGTEIIFIDRDYTADRKIISKRELGNVLMETTSGKECVLMFDESVQIIGWQEALQVLDKSRVQVYYFSLACRQVPLCVKVF